LLHAGEIGDCEHLMQGLGNKRSQQQQTSEQKQPLISAEIDTSMHYTYYMCYINNIQYSVKTIQNLKPRIEAALD